MRKYIVTLTTIVTVNVPESVSEEDIDLYISDAINENWDNLDWNEMDYKEVRNNVK
jgi:hypothetical protein